MASLTPTPLPALPLSQVQDPAARKSLESILVHLQRTRRVIFDSSKEDSLGASLGALQDRPKDIYTFPLGTVTVTEVDPGYAVTPLEVVASGRVSEVKLYGQRAATGTIVVQVLAGVRTLATPTVITGQTRVSVSPDGKSVEKDEMLKVVVMEASSSPGLDDAVLQVLVV